MDKLLRWKRNSEGHLFLQVLQNDVWVSYTQATYKQPDYQMLGIKTSEGFATAQKYLTLGYRYVRFEENYSDEQ
jgi:hypothetical protein